MPELPEVETVVKGIKPIFEGQTISTIVLNRPDLRFPFPDNFQNQLCQHRVDRVYRRAKYICLDFFNDLTLLWHLGMSGRVIVNETEPDNKHDHVLFYLSNSQRIRYRDPRRFGFMDIVKTNELAGSKFIHHLGPEPLSSDFSAAYLKIALSRRKGPIKPALMDAKLVVGVGNIYASEALFLANIHPETPSNQITNHQNLTDAIKLVLKKAILSGGSTLRDHVRPDGELGYFQHEFNVYGKYGALCSTCGNSKISQITQAGRSTFFCPTCQIKEATEFS